MIATARDYFAATTAVVAAGAAGAAVVDAGAAVAVVVVVLEVVVAVAADADADPAAGYRLSGPASAPSGTVPLLAAGSVVTS